MMFLKLKKHVLYYIYALFTCLFGFFLHSLESNVTLLTAFLWLIIGPLTILSTIELFKKHYGAIFDALGIAVMMLFGSVVVFMLVTNIPQLLGHPVLFLKANQEIWIIDRGSGEQTIHNFFPVLVKKGNDYIQTPEYVSVKFFADTRTVNFPVRVCQPYLYRDINVVIKTDIDANGGVTYTNDVIGQLHRVGLCASPTEFHSRLK